jgi:hypothetical protein
LTAATDSNRAAPAWTSRDSKRGRIGFPVPDRTRIDDLALACNRIRTCAPPALGLLAAPCNRIRTCAPPALGLLAALRAPASAGAAAQPTPHVPSLLRCCTATKYSSRTGATWPQPTAVGPLTSVSTIDDLAADSSGRRGTDLDPGDATAVDSRTQPDTRRDADPHGRLPDSQNPSGAENMRPTRRSHRSRSCCLRRSTGVADAGEAEPSGGGSAGSNPAGGTQNKGTVVEIPSAGDRGDRFAV